MFDLRNLKIRFQLLPTLLFGAFVIILTSVSATIAVSKARQMAEDSARELFSQIVQRNVDRLGASIRGIVLAVDEQSQRQVPRLFEDEGEGEGRASVLPTLVTLLRAYPDAYGFYIGFADDDYFQAIGVRGNAQVARQIGAPEGTIFALRSIIRQADGSRRERWTYLDVDEVPIGQTERRAVYAPSVRPWFIAAQASASLQVTEPYTFASLGAMGFTFSRALSSGAGVFGADVSFAELQAFAAATIDGGGGGFVVADADGHALVAQASGRFGEQPVSLGEPLRAARNAFFAEAGRVVTEGSRIAMVDGEAIAYASRNVDLLPGRTLHVSAFAPMSLYADPIQRTRNEILLLAGGTLIIFLPLAYWASRRIAGTLGALTRESERIQNMDFRDGEPVQSVFYEIGLLGRALQTMKSAIRQRTEALDGALAQLEGLVHSGIQLASGQSQESLLRQALESAVRLAGAQGAQFWLAGDAAGSPGLDLRLACAHGSALGDAAVVGGRTNHPCVQVARRREPLRIGTAEMAGWDLAGITSGQPPRALLAVPVLARGERLLGVLLLADPQTARGAALPEFAPDVVPYARTLAAQAGIGLENIGLLAAKRELMDSLVQLIASAIDAKSAYTGGHCARVPELAVMLAEAAADVGDGPLAAFRFETDDEWREFRIGAWLHDCGKVTTPEYVVDKGSKLETLYNRIHEVRTRFEVLLRDAEIARLQALAGGADAQAAQAAFDARSRQLQDDFAFVARSNVGTEFTAPEVHARLAAIGAQTWTRHFDDRLGLSHAEEVRLAAIPAQPLPVAEALLADKPEHIQPRTGRDQLPASLGFNMPVPQHLYNHGELYNLGIDRGTLTPEERYKINEHVVQTIVMLEQLPLPANLRRVPEYAGTHHETLTGSGYPRGLTAEQLSVPARIMAIADVFEALTASDRPYKKAKTLSEAVNILAGFKKRGHIDPVLFDLFLSSGVYRRYAERFLAPEQIDEVDVAAYVG
ncbi:MAG: HD domain-containing phosphohydrolase [Comamonas sp.]